VSAIPANKKTTDDTARLTISGLDHDGRGVGRLADGKVMFVEGALPGEEVIVKLVRRKRKHDSGVVIDIVHASADRVAPPCEYFGVCGGCSLQHMRSSAQISTKQTILRDNLQRLACTKPEEWLTPISGPTSGYRRKARLGVRFVTKKGGVLVGFREKRSSYLTSLKSCLVMDKRFSDLLPDLHRVISELSCPDKIAQIEIAAGDASATLVFRHLVELDNRDNQLLSEFGRARDVNIMLQPGGPDSIYCLWPDTPNVLSYNLPEFDVSFTFQATDFTQVNAKINRKMVSLAIQLLDLKTNDRVLDLFCGLGNFTLPVARKAGQVMGIEGSAALVNAARENARQNGLTNAEFRCADLFSVETGCPWQDYHFNKLLLDPPRSGASEVLRQLPDDGPERIVYVSCDPATLARDTDYLVNLRKYRLSKAGVMDMFPHTSHVESIAVFDRVR